MEGYVHVVQLLCGRVFVFAIKPCNIPSLSRLTQRMTVTELPKTLVNILGTLLAENGLLSWQILDEKSSNIVVQILFDNGHCHPTTDGQSAETMAAYCYLKCSTIDCNDCTSSIHKYTGIYKR